MLVSLEQALAQVQALTARLEPVARTEEVALGRALGRVLAAPLRADRDQPPFDRGTRDGYAVHSADLAQGEAELSCLGELPAGAAFEGQVPRGACVEIMTGAPLPAGTDAVVMVEHGESLGGARVRLRASLQPGDNVVPAGTEARAGEEVLPAGRRLDAAALGLAASVGLTRPLVRARPLVAVLTTGNEIVPTEASPSRHQIRNANEALLVAAVEAFGGQAQVLGPVTDEPLPLRQALQSARAADLVLVTGGVSKGKHDHVKSVLEELDAEIVFAGVAMRPGKPVVLAHLAQAGGPVPVLALPGNPLSALVGFGLFGRPLLGRLAGLPHWAPLFHELPLAEAYEARGSDFTILLPAEVQAQGLEASVRPLPWRGSGDLVMMANAHAWLCLPPHVDRLAAGARVKVLDKA